jgi:hypothetical protein
MTGSNWNQKILCRLAKKARPQVLAIQLDEVEGVEEHVPVMLAVADTLERCEPVVVARDGFPIDDARPPRQSAGSGESCHCRGRL